MMELLKEHSELQAEQRDTQEELSACQQHLSRPPLSDFEGRSRRLAAQSERLGGSEDAGRERQRGGGAQGELCAGAFN